MGILKKTIGVCTRNKLMKGVAEITMILIMGILVIIILSFLMYIRG